MWRPQTLQQCNFLLPYYSNYCRKVWHNVFTDEELQKIIEFAGKESNQPTQPLRSSSFPSFSVAGMCIVTRELTKQASQK